MGSLGSTWAGLWLCHSNSPTYKYKSPLIYFSSKLRVDAWIYFSSSSIQKCTYIDQEQGSIMHILACQIFVVQNLTYISYLRIRVGYL